MSDVSKPLQPVFADYVDGETAQTHRVSVTIAGKAPGGALKLELPEQNGAVEWLLGDLRLIPDQAAPGIAVIGLTGDHPARLYVYDPSTAGYLLANCPRLKRPDKTPNLGRRLSTLVTGAVASVALIIFVLIPVMANQLALLLPRAGEQALGDTTYEQIRNALGHERGLAVWECSGENGTRALEKMLARLAGAAQFDYRLRVHVLDHQMVNAFALPGGHIVLFRGLLEQAESPEEIAGVIGHEMGHVERRDPTRLALRSAGSIGVLGLLFGDFAGGTVVLFLAEQLIQAQYSQDAEAKSDAFAHALLAAAGLPTSGMADFFLRLRDEFGDESGLMSHLASHPDLLGRADKAEAADVTNGNFKPVLDRWEWRALQSMCQQGS